MLPDIVFPFIIYPESKYIYSQILSETTETVPLSAFSTTILIGKLQKGDAVISFKIGEIRK